MSYTIKGDLSVQRRASAGLAIQHTSWQTGKGYLVNDTVIQNGDLYVCQTAHTSAALFASDLLKWRKAGAYTWIVSTNNMTTVDGDNVIIVGAHTINLPSSPQNGDSVRFATPVDWATRGCTWVASGATTVGLGQTLPSGFDTAEFIYNATANNWVISLGGASPVGETIQSINATGAITAWNSIVLIGGTAPTANMTLTLPTVAADLGKTIKFVRLDSTSFTVTIAANGSEVVNLATAGSELNSQYGSLTVEAISSTTSSQVASVSSNASASGDSISKSVTQAAHGLSVLNAVYINGSGSYIKGRADADATSDVVGVVSAVPGAGSFTLLQQGFLSGFTGLTPGQGIFLSDSTAGLLTQTEPTAATSWRKPIGIAISATTAWIDIQPGTPVTGQTAVAVSGTLTSIVDAQTTNSTTFVDVSGGSFTLSVPGTYSVAISLSTWNGAGGTITYFQLVDGSSTFVPNSHFAYQQTGAGNQTIRVHHTVQISVSAPTTYRLQWRAPSGGLSTINNDTIDGQSTISWLQVGGVPVPMSLAGEYGEALNPATVSIGAGNTSSSTAVDVFSFNIPSPGVWEVIATAKAFIGSTGSNRAASFAIFDSSNVLVPNSQGFTGFLSGTTPAGTFSGTSTSFITTSVSATYKMRAWNNNATAGVQIEGGTADVDGKTKVVFRKVSGFTPTTGSTVDYGQFTYTNSAGFNLTANDSVIPLDTTVAGNLAVIANRITLPAGKTFKLVGTVPYSNSATANFDTQFYNVTAGTYLGSTRSAVLNATLANTGYVEAHITTSVATQIEFRVRTVSGGAYSLGAADISRQQGPSVSVQQLGSTATTTTTLSRVAATNATAFSVPNAANTVISTGWVTTGTLGQTDTTNSFNTATGVFTAPRTRRYSISAALRTANVAWAAGNSITLQINVNGTLVREVTSFAPAMTDRLSVALSSVVSLNAGDQVTVSMFQNRGAATTLNGLAPNNYFTIEEMVDAA